MTPEIARQAIEALLRIAAEANGVEIELTAKRKEDSDGIQN